MSDLGDLFHGRRARTVAALLAVAGLGLAAPAGATLLVYEPFSYADGTFLDGEAATGQNLTGSYTPIGGLSQQRLRVDAPGLDYGNLVGAPTPAGNRANDPAGVTAAGATVSLAQPVLVGPGDAIFWSALITFDDSTGGNRLANITLSDDATGDILFIGEGAAGVRNVRVAADTLTTGGLIADGSGDAFSDGETLLLIGRYSNSAASTGDLLELIGYDTADADVLPASFDPADPNAEFAFEVGGIDIDLAQITSITFTIRGDDNNFIDELRIGTTYADVVPEPGLALLLGIGLGTLASHLGRRIGPLTSR